MIQQFLDRADAAYAELLEELGRQDVDLDVVAQRYEQAKGYDYFQSSLGERVREELQAMYERAERAEL